MLLCLDKAIKYLFGNTEPGKQTPFAKFYHFCDDGEAGLENHNDRVSKCQQWGLKWPTDDFWKAGDDIRKSTQKQLAGCAY
ncbi:hypothetical protein CDAR_43821 [Caerostris darwini]|uniref:Uncharacterized protein n=1 Tax=Caerostris darwini TaxID=1538125 RepID=A0AAV4WGQ2_9ARAC|nr:hypothetical protein CDAR_43821 [Caerostris darwini]